MERTAEDLEEFVKNIVNDAFDEKVKEHSKQFKIPKKRILSYISWYLNRILIRAKEGSCVIKAFKEWVEFYSETYPFLSKEEIEFAIKEHLAVSEKSFHSS